MGCQGIITIKGDDEEEDNNNEMVMRLRYLVDSLQCMTIRSTAKATTYQDLLQMLLFSQKKYTNALNCSKGGGGSGSVTAQEMYFPKLDRDDLHPRQC